MKSIFILSLCLVFNTPLFSQSQCKSYSEPALKLVEASTDDIKKIAEQICSSYALDAFRLLVAKKSTVAELQHAVSVNSSYALKAFRIVLNLSLIHI